MKKVSKWPMVMGIIGFLLMVPIMLIALGGGVFLAKAGLDAAKTTLFITVQLPNLIGLVASIASPRAPRISGYLMLASGSVVLILSLLAGTLMVGISTSLLYLGGGILLLEEAKKHRP